VTNESSLLFQKYFDLENSSSSSHSSASMTDQIDNDSSSSSYKNRNNNSNNSSSYLLKVLSIIPKGSTLTELWASPVTRALIKMYKKELILSGVLKFIKAALNLLPALLVSSILAAVEVQSTANCEYISQNSILLEKSSLLNRLFQSIATICAQRFEAISYTFLLLLVLCTKTLVDGQYFDQAINLGQSVRSTLASVIYRKSTQLTPASRQNNTVSRSILLLFPLFIIVSF